MSSLQEYRLDEQIGFLLRRAHQYASSVFQDKMSELALTPPQFSALAKIREQQEVSQNKLGRLIDTDPATMQGIVKRLVDRGYIERLPDKDHKRKINLRLSKDGQQLVDAATRIAADVSLETLSALNADEKSQLTRLLAKLVDSNAG